MPAARASIRLNLGQGERPVPVLLEPQGLSGLGDAAEEDRARDTPRPGGV